MAYQKTEHIAAGQFKSGKNQIDIFQAYLGTCVGIALYDESTKVGGMIHILLPEPPGFTGVDFPSKYASTGVPILIEELVKLGAQPENLKASVAGGALVGPISHQDINLDIGGRSTDIAVSILKASGIKTIKSETGGFFTCTLELNMASGKTAIKPAWEGSNKPSNDFFAPAIEDIKQTIDELKPIPQTALKIFRMFQSGQHDISDITKELSRDQVLSGQTLKLCNSALFSGMIKIDTLKDAILLLGEDLLVKSIITVAVNTYYNQTGTSGYSLCKGGLFFHAVGVAATAEKIAEMADSPAKKTAYTAGLLHDIGKVILDQYIAEAAPLLFRKLSQGEECVTDAEKKIFGISHSEAGGLLASKWQFSDSLSEAILLHHTPEKAKVNKDLVYIIYLADLLMERFNAGFDLEKMQTKSFKNALDHLGFTIKDIPELVDVIPIDAINNNEILN